MDSVLEESCWIGRVFLRILYPKMSGFKLSNILACEKIRNL